MAADSTKICRELVRFTRRILFARAPEAIAHAIGQLLLSLGAESYRIRLIAHGRRETLASRSCDQAPDGLRPAHMRGATWVIGAGPTHADPRHVLCVIDLGS